MYIETSSGRSGLKARLVSPAINGTEQMCLGFFYHMYGKDVKTLNVYFARRDFLSSPVWRKHGAQGTGWTQDKIDIAGGPATTGVTNIVFEGVRGLSYLGDIAIDDVSLTPGPCDKGTGIFCSFDTGTCGWTYDASGNYHWKIGANGTATYGTGPSYDHTSGHGKYMQTEIRSQVPQEQKTHLTSPKIRGSHRMCLVFYYHMFGLHVNKLNVLFSRSKSLGIPVWTKVKSQGDFWERATVQIVGGSATSSVTNIVFEGVSGAGIQGDIAINDVSITPGTCDDGNSCDFELNKCGWSNSQTDNSDWVIQRGTRSIRSYTGPATDHTKGYWEGKYLTIKTTSQGPGKIAILDSATFLEGSSRCMTFYYYMFGETFGTLNILVRPTGHNASVVWSLVGKHSQKWMKGVVPIPQERSVYQVLIEGDRRNCITCNIAIDDIIFNNQSPCILTPQKASVTPPVPDLLIEPNSDTINVLVGDNLTVHCVDKDAKPVIKSFTWSHNDRESTSELFYIQNVTKSDEGRLTCSANNGVGTTPGQKKILILVHERSQVPGAHGAVSNKWSTIHTAALVTGIVAIFIIIVLVAVLVYLLRKVGTASVLKAGSSEPKKISAATNPVDDQDNNDDDDVIYENTTTNDVSTYETSAQMQHRGSFHRYESVELGKNKENMQESHNTNTTAWTSTLTKF